MPATITRKRYPHGKYLIQAQGNPDYKEIAEKALVAAIEVYPQLNKDIFIDLMRKSDIPESAIEEYLRSLNIENKTFSEDHPEMDYMIGVQTSMSVGYKNK